MTWYYSVGVAGFEPTTFLSRSNLGDVLSPANELIDGLHLLTDGEWFWYPDLAHYVERYHVPVDEVLSSTHASVDGPHRKPS
ncbi:hypothetical protein [Streptomyces sp. NPDC058255]|uniref:hypothetical protein n=1 Tax=Streptomyces sp. NPDC058255 TaxID=3346407 RepID=UPI0036E71581